MLKLGLAFRFEAGDTLSEVSDLHGIAYGVQDLASPHPFPKEGKGWGTCDLSRDCPFDRNQRS